MSTKWTSPSVNVIIRRDKTKTELEQLLHGCCGSPSISSWKIAITNGNFITWPGLDNISILKHLPLSIATVKGHLDQERKHLQSTKLKNGNIHDDFFPVPSQPNVKSYDACATIIPFTSRDTTYHNLTGRFPHTSSCGSQYILVVYDYDSNAILHSALKNKTAAEITKGWTNIYEHLQ
jgi:hypothetical protein